MTIRADATVPEVVRWLRDEAQRHAGQRGASARVEALSVAASVLEQAAGLDAAEPAELWSKFDVAREYDMTVEAARKALTRSGIAVAGHSEPERGRTTNLYPAAEVRQRMEARRAPAPEPAVEAPETAVEPSEPPAGMVALSEDYREVLDYLVPATDRDPRAYCEAVAKRDLWHQDYATGEWQRLETGFLHTTLKAMENRGLVDRRNRYESAIRGPRTRYTVATLTDAGREAHRTGWMPKRPIRKDQPA